MTLAASVERQRFIVLHGLRGVAATIVIFVHAGIFLPGNPHLVPGGHLAVDLFFLLSGFVIAHAYDARFQAGLTFREFAIARLVRLYPLYFVALLVALVTVLVTIFVKGIGEFSRATLLAGFLLSPLFVPTPPPVTNNDLLFPLNGPAWSLFFELIVNAGYAILATRLTQKALWIIVILSAFGLTFAAIQLTNLDGGAHWAESWVGLLRVVFSFTLGVLLRRHHLGIAQCSNIAATGLMAACAALMLVDVGAEIRPYFDLMVIAMVWPMLVIWASRLDLRGWAVELAEVSGEASYGIYVTHTPMLALFSIATFGFTGLEYDQHSWWWLMGVVATIICISTILAYWFDRPIRRIVMGRIRRPRLATGVTQF